MTETSRKPVERKVDDRRREQRQDLAQRETADDRQAQRPAQLGTGAGAQEHGQGAEHRCERGHQDRSEA